MPFNKQAIMFTNQFGSSKLCCQMNSELAVMCLPLMTFILFRFCHTRIKPVLCNGSTLYNRNNWQMLNYLRVAEVKSMHS